MEQAPLSPVGEPAEGLDDVWAFFSGTRVVINPSGAR